MEIEMRKKILMVLIIGSMAFSAGVVDTIERNNANIENERRQQELERRQKELENENFGKEPVIVEPDEQVDTSQRFFIRKIEVQDSYKLLSQGEIKQVFCYTKVETVSDSLIKSNY